MLKERYSGQFLLARMIDVRNHACYRIGPIFEGIKFRGFLAY